MSGGRTFKFEDVKTPYLIGEIGINHNGSLEVAKKLMDAVFCCNWDCAKFQKRNPEISVPENQKNIMRDTPWGKMTYLEYKYRVEFSKKEYDVIDFYCKQKPIDWTVSVWDLPSLEFLVGNFAPPFIKIPSAKLTDLALLVEASKTRIPLLVSTGMSTVEEIDAAFNTILKYGDKPALLHANSSYPASHTELNLRVIPYLKERYKCIVGYSGHEENLEPTIVAVSLGARIVERHITLSHQMWGTDQKASLEVLAMDMLAKRLADVDAMLGDGVKRVFDSELPVREKLRGS